MERNHILSLLVENQPGVLSRVTGLVSRRGFNIESLAVAPTEDPGLSRLTAIVRADDVSIEQVKKQLNKLVCVYKVNALDPLADVVRELLLVKVAAGAEERAGVLSLAGSFGATVLDAAADGITLELAGDETRLAGFEELLRPFGIKEVARTGKIAVSRDARGQS